MIIEIYHYNKNKLKYLRTMNKNNTNKKYNDIIKEDSSSYLNYSLYDCY